jgi:thiosulfate/3-mercaptopyruvate sulfurtransferase
VIDARPAPRFLGGPEPLKGVRSGNIKGSLNVPFPTMSNPDGTVKSQEELIKVLHAAGVDILKPTINLCGSGMCACLIDMI